MIARQRRVHRFNLAPLVSPFRWQLAGPAAAIAAALAAYPGGIVDRVVKLSNGDCNVHYIGVNWPHHVFLNRDFNVIGAE